MKPVYHNPLFYVPSSLAFTFFVLAGLTYVLDLLSPAFWIEILEDIASQSYDEIANTCGLARLGFQVFDSLNSNRPFVFLWLTCSWISLTWMMILPLDIILCYRLKLRYSVAGKIAYAQAVLWTVVAPLIWVYMNPVLVGRFIAGIFYVMNGC
ncbi:MAG: hypothetical protein HLUCCO16_20095 [Phormidium sp. OSCR]|nr:MAG: hypothetical protein HLUCCO16_20095 [Phormidium sp. OSCR]